MNTTLKIGKFALGAIVGSLLWAGCASSGPHTQQPALLEQTMDLQNTGPETHPQWRTDADPFYNSVNLQPWDVESIQ